MTEQTHAARCQSHLEPLPCALCEENSKRGYEVLMLAGRCANGSELDHGSRWHAVKPDDYTALCGAKPGRRSAGWSSYTVLGQPATCPRCLKKLGRAPIDVDHLISRRKKLTDRRDGLTDWKRVRRIDAQLAEIPSGENNTIDLLLGRPCAVLPERAYIQAQAVTNEQAAPVAQAKRDEFLEWVKDQTDDFAAHMAQYGADMQDTPKDWRDMRGDLAL